MVSGFVGAVGRRALVVTVTIGVGITVAAIAYGVSVIGLLHNFLLVGCFLLVDGCFYDFTSCLFIAMDFLDELLATLPSHELVNIICGQLRLHLAGQSDWFAVITNWFGLCTNRLLLDGLLLDRG